MNDDKILNLYFSPNGETEKIAKFYNEELETELIDLTKPNVRENIGSLKSNYAIINVPVYAHNVPITIRKILINSKFNYVVLNITYGGFDYGNILRRIQKYLRSSKIIAYSITPVTHVYLNNNIDVDYNKYLPLIQRLKDKSTKAISIPYKFDIFPGFLEQFLTDMNYKLIYNESSCIHCGLCKRKCPTESIIGDIIIPKSCVKCGICVNLCPTKAITGKKSLIMRLYFKKKIRTSVIIR